MYIDDETEQLVKQLLESHPGIQKFLAEEQSRVLAEKKISEQDEFIAAWLHHALLQQIALLLSSTKEKNSDKKKSKIVPYTIIVIAGILLAACEGFDGMTSLISILHLPALVILLAGLAFSLLSIIVFYGYELQQVAQNLGIEPKLAPELLDIYLAQLNEIKTIRRRLSVRYLVAQNESQLDETLKIIHLLCTSLIQIQQAAEVFNTTLNSRKIIWIKAAVTCIAGLLFFSSGFFAGNSVALFLLHMALPAMSMTAWPVILLSVLVGLAALSLYWYVEKVGLTKIISHWFGLNEDKIEQLCNSDSEKEEIDSLLEKWLLVKEKRKLENNIPCLSTGFTKLHQIFAPKSEAPQQRAPERRHSIS